MNETVLRTVPGEDASGLSWLSEVLLEHLLVSHNNTETVNVTQLIQYHP